MMRLSDHGSAARLTVSGLVWAEKHLFLERPTDDHTEGLIVLGYLDRYLSGKYNYKEINSLRMSSIPRVDMFHQPIYRLFNNYWNKENEMQM